MVPGYGAAIITQSGMFSSDITMSQRSLPLAYMVSAGNQAVLGPEDLLESVSYTHLTLPTNREV